MSPTKLVLACIFALLTGTVMADSTPLQPGLLERASDSAQQALEHTKTGFQALADKGASFLGIKYRFGGTAPETGFDCSGLVRKVFGDALGLNLPRTAAEMSKLGEKVGKDEMKPGDLVFFHTMRQTFSHVGIYLGDNQFLHAPSKGGVVRVEKMDTKYWNKRFSGARRLMPEADAAELPPQGVTQSLSPNSAQTSQLAPQLVDGAPKAQ